MKKNLLAVLITFLSSSLFAQFNAKDLSNTWKLIKVEENGTSVEPKHTQLVIEINKNNTFSITAANEETHNGDWTLNEDGKTLTLDDPTRDYTQVLTIVDLDKTHFAVENFDGENNTFYFIPLGKKKHSDLNHVEHSVAKKWTCFKSDKETNLGLIIEFKEDYTFLVIPAGSKIPVATGNWKLSVDKKKVLMDKKDGEHMELTIVERHSHELVLKNDETDITNHFHDPKRTRTDIQEGVIITNKNKPLHHEVD